MKTIVASLALSLLFVSSANAQDQESPKEKLHRDFPQVQLILPSIPSWRFNFDRNRWERDSQPQIQEILPAAEDDIDELLIALRTVGLRTISKPKHIAAQESAAQESLPSDPS